MKKLLALIIVLVLTAGIAGCGEKETTTDTSGNTETATKTEDKAEDKKEEVKEDMEDVTLEIFQFKVEIVDQLDTLVEDFEAEYPYIDVVMDTAGGGQDYGAMLKSRMNSGNEPAIFNVPGPTERELWLDYLEPLNDQPWVDTAFAGTLDNITQDGNVYGQPYGLEGYGIIYNKGMFEQAGIDAASITSLSALEDAFATLEAQKDALGIETVLSYSVGDSAWWTAAYHTFNVPFAMQDEPLAYTATLTDGGTTIVGNPAMEGFVNLLDLFFEYSYTDLINTSYDDQVANFALGKTAALHQGNWTIGMIQEIDDTIDMAFLPIPMSDDASMPNDSIPVGVPNYWVVNTKLDDSVKDAAKLFLNYIADTDRGHKFLVEECQFIPAFSSVKLAPVDSLAESIMAYSAEGRTIPWVWHSFPSGYNEVDAKEAIQKYYLGEFTGDEFLAYLDEKWAEKSAE